MIFGAIQIQVILHFELQYFFFGFWCYCCIGLISSMWRRVATCDEGVNTCFLSDSAALNHATMNSIHNVVPSTLVHGLTEVSKVAVELESPRPG